MIEREWYTGPPPEDGWYYVKGLLGGLSPAYLESWLEAGMVWGTNEGDSLTPIEDEGINPATMEWANCNAETLAMDRVLGLQLKIGELPQQRNKLLSLLEEVDTVPWANPSYQICPWCKKRSDTYHKEPKHYLDCHKENTVAEVKGGRG